MVIYTTLVLPEIMSGNTYGVFSATELLKTWCPWIGFVLVLFRGWSCKNVKLFTMLVAKLANLYYRVLSPCRSQLTLMAQQNSKCYNKCPQVCRGSSLTLLSCRKSKFLEKNFHKQS